MSIKSIETIPQLNRQLGSKDMLYTCEFVLRILYLLVIKFISQEVC